MRARRSRNDLILVRRICPSALARRWRRRGDEESDADSNEGDEEPDLDDAMEAMLQAELDKMERDG